MATTYVFAITDRRSKFFDDGFCQVNIVGAVGRDRGLRLASEGCLAGACMLTGVCEKLRDMLAMIDDWRSS